MKKSEKMHSFRVIRSEPHQKKIFVAKTHFLGIIGDFRYAIKIWQDKIFLPYQVFLGHNLENFQKKKNPP